VVLVFFTGVEVSWITYDMIGEEDALKKSARLSTSTPKLGLHTEEEQAVALNLAEAAYERAVEAHERRDPIAMASEIGYIKAISELAEAERASVVFEITRDQVLRLDAIFTQIT
jgi:hypothetical protein